MRDNKQIKVNRVEIKMNIKLFSFLQYKHRIVFIQA